MAPKSRSLAPDLESKIRQVALQLRRREWIRGWMRFGAATFVITLCVTGLLRFPDTLGLPRWQAIGLFFLSEMIAGWWFVFRPMRKPLSLKRVALYIDERHPELENRIVSAVELSSGETKGVSLWMIERCLEESSVFAERLPWGRLMAPAVTAEWILVILFFFFLSLGVILFRNDLWIPRWTWSHSETVAIQRSESYDFKVEPGDARVRVGDNQTVFVTSEAVGPKAVILWRSAARPVSAETEKDDWISEVMLAGASEQVHHHAFTNIREDMIYRVRFGDQTSAEYKIVTWIPPRVDEINLTYHYPEYLNRAPREVPNSGNITAIEGTAVDLEVKANKAVKRAEMVLAQGERIALEKSTDAVWRGRIEVAKNDKYHIELIDAENQASEYNPNYDITAELDKPPETKIAFPRGDAKVTAMDEVPFEFRVSDDFGIQSYGLQYEVVGQGVKRIVLEEARRAAAGSESGPEIRLAADGKYMLPLETLGLRAGDLVTWTVWAKDGKPDRDPSTELSDLYFLEIRPYRSEFEEAVSDQQGMPGMQEQESSDQKEIIIATWNVRRRFKNLSETEYHAQREVIEEAQSALIEKFKSNMKPGVAPDPKLKEIIKVMSEAFAKLKDADFPNPDTSLGQAIERMQAAYSLMLKLQPKKSQVVRSDKPMQGAGGAKNPPEIEDLEMNRNRNFYEDEKRTEQNQAAVNQSINKLKELAERQKLIGAEIAKLISELKKAETEEEKEKLERRLEKLREEEKKNLERLDEMQRDLSKSGMESQQARQASAGLEEVREQMNKSLKNMEQSRLQQARLASSRAQDKMGEIEKNLENLSRAAAAEQMKHVQGEMEEIKKKQEALKDQLQNLQGETESSSLRPQKAGGEDVASLLKQKTELAEQFKKLMNEAADLAEKSASTQELMSRKLGDWLRETSGEGIMEDMLAGEPMLRHGVWEGALDQEKKVGKKLEQASKKLGEVAESLAADDLEGMQKALGNLRDALDAAKARKLAQERETAMNSAAQKGSAESERADTATGNQKNGESDSGSPEAAEHMRRGESAMKQGRPDEAIREFEQALAADPQNAEAHNDLGMAQAQRGDFEKAAEEFQKALQFNPDHKAARNNLEKTQALREAKAGSKETASQDSKRGDGPSESKEPGEQKGDGKSEGKSPGDQEGKGSESASKGAPGEGKSPGEQGQDGSGKGQAKGGKESSADAAGDQPGGDSSSPSGQGEGRDAKANQGSERGGRQQGGREQGITRGGNFRDPNGRGSGGNANLWATPPSPDFMNEFIESDYRRWMERMRDAEALLPKDAPLRGDIERVRGRLEEIRRDFKRHSIPPQYDLFLGDILNPLAETADKLEAEILKSLRSEEFMLTDEGNIPAQYRKRVADYFEALTTLGDAPAK